MAILQSDRPAGRKCPHMQDQSPAGICPAGRISCRRIFPQPPPSSISTIPSF